MIIIEKYPWQTGLWQRISEMRSRMPHALLLQGRSGIGKMDFAVRFAQSLLCDRPLPEQDACGLCQSCNWFQQGNHPDFRLLEPGETDGGVDEEPGAVSKPTKKLQISVDQVRELADFLGLTSHRAGLRIVLLHPAEALNVASANALLKMLEEPPPDVIFILVTHQPQRLLPTIRSRCHVLDMPVPPRQAAEDWLVSKGISQVSRRLAYAGGAPLHALQEDAAEDKRRLDILEMLSLGAQLDPFVVAGACARTGMIEAVTMLQKWLYDLFSIRMTGHVRYHVQQLQSLQGLAKRVDLNRLLDFQRVLDEAGRHARHPLNADMQLEALMIQYAQIFAKA